MDNEEKRSAYRFLSMGHWFGGLPGALQQQILDRSIERKYVKGQAISVEDTPPRGLYALLEGHVHVVREFGTGEEGLLHIGEPGFWFGEYGVLCGRPTLVTIVARAPVRLLFLSKAQFDHIVADEPRYFAEFAKLAFSRYAALVRAVVEIRGLAPEARLRQRLYLVTCLRQQDRPAADPVFITISQMELARMLGVSRQTLNPMLGKLQQEGLIKVEFRRIQILDPARLADPYPPLAPADRRRASGRPRPLSERLQAGSGRVD